MKVGEIRDILNQIEKRKQAIAKERDEIRALFSDVEDLLDSFHRGVEGMESGLREIADALDAVSEVV